jgi:outer membrane protein OmpA-like peptidoglycan-associated protein
MSIKIKSYSEFLESKLNEEKGIKDWLLGAALTTSTIAPVQKVSAEPVYIDTDLTKIETPYKDKKITKKTITLDKGSEKLKQNRIKSLIRNGWTLDSTTVDTLWREVVKSNPKTVVVEEIFKLDIEGDQFETGKFELKKEIIDGIYTAVDKIISEESVITDFIIESSTDREPIKLSYGNKTGNYALAQKRGDAVSNLLISMGINGSIIKVNPKAEQGPDIFKENMNETDKRNARKITKDFRYVTLSIIYIKKDEIFYPRVKDEIPNVVTTYHLSKEYQSGVLKRHPNKEFLPSKKNSSFIGETIRESGSTKCDYFGNKNAWWNKLKP